jgi:hypothetical protein
MRVSAFELILETERIHRQAAVKAGVGFAVPALYQYPAQPTDAPFLATNARGTFLPVRSKYGVVRLAFSECPLGSESRVLAELYRVLWGISVQSQWSNRCSSIAAAVAHMRGTGIEPWAIVVSPSFLEDACGTPVTLEDAEEIMLVQGHVAESDGVKVLAAGLPVGQAIVTAAPPDVGNYFRVDQHLGVLIRRADRSLGLVGDEVA